MAGKGDKPTYGKDTVGFLSESSLLPRPARPITGVDAGSLLSLHSVIQATRAQKDWAAAGVGKSDARHGSGTMQPNTPLDTTNRSTGCAHVGRFMGQPSAAGVGVGAGAGQRDADAGSLSLVQSLLAAAVGNVDEADEMEVDDKQPVTSPLAFPPSATPSGRQGEGQADAGATASMPQQGVQGLEAFIRGQIGQGALGAGLYTALLNNPGLDTHGIAVALRQERTGGRVQDAQAKRQQDRARKAQQAMEALLQGGAAPAGQSEGRVGPVNPLSGSVYGASQHPT